MDERAYLIRYGVMGHIGKFVALPGCETSLERDQLVVIQTHRGLELGEVLVPASEMSARERMGRRSQRPRRAWTIRPARPLRPTGPTCSAPAGPRT